MNAIPKYSLGCVGACVLIAAHQLLEGWAIATLWGWFVVTKFGLPPLGIPDAVGMNLIMSLFVNRVSASSIKSMPLPEKATLLLVSFIIPITSVAIGWIVKRLM